MTAMWTRSAPTPCNAAATERDARATDSASATVRSPMWSICRRVTTMQYPRYGFGLASIGGMWNATAFSSSQRRPPGRSISPATSLQTRQRPFTARKITQGRGTSRPCGRVILPHTGTAELLFTGWINRAAANGYSRTMAVPHQPTAGGAVRTSPDVRDRPHPPRRRIRNASRPTGRTRLRAHRLATADRPGPRSRIRDTYGSRSRERVRCAQGAFRNTGPGEAPITRVE
jgi:hypothetical protein